MTYGLRDIVDDYSAVGIPIVHGRERLVSFLPGSVPYLELDCRGFVEGDGLGEEGGADCGFPVVIELVLQPSTDISLLELHAELTFTNRRTSEL